MRNLDLEREQDDASWNEVFGPRNEHEAHYRRCQTGEYFAHPDPSQCGCRGSGYYLSQVDTWHECPFHHIVGQAHPEDLEEFEVSDTEPVPTARDTVPTPPPTFEDEDDIPF